MTLFTEKEFGGRIMNKRVIAILLLVVIALYAASAFAASACDYCNGGKIMKHYTSWFTMYSWRGTKNGVRGTYYHKSRDGEYVCNKCHHYYGTFDTQEKTVFEAD